MNLEVMDYVEVLHPGRFRAAMQRVMQKADPQLTLINVVAVAIISALLTGISSLSPQQAMQPPPAGSVDAIAAMQQFTEQMYTPLGIIVTAIQGIVLFYVGMYILLAICRALGGNGKFLEQAYLFSVIGVATSVVGFIISAPPLLLSLASPAIGGGLECITGLISLAFVVYLIYIYYYATAAIHPQLGKWKTIGAMAAYVISTTIIGIIVILTRVIIGI